MKTIDVTDRKISILGLSMDGYKEAVITSITPHVFYRFRYTDGGWAVGFLGEKGVVDPILDNGKNRLILEEIKKLEEQVATLKNRICSLNDGLERLDIAKIFAELTAGEREEENGN